MRYRGTRPVQKKFRVTDYEDRKIIEQYKKMRNEDRFSGARIMAEADMSELKKRYAFAYGVDPSTIKVEDFEYESPPIVDEIVEDEIPTLVETEEVVYGQSIQFFGFSEYDIGSTGTNANRVSSDCKITVEFYNHSKRHLWLKSADGLTQYLPPAYGSLLENTEPDDDYLAVKQTITIAATRERLTTMLRSIKRERKIIEGQLKNSISTEQSKFLTYVHSLLSDYLQEVEFAIKNHQINNYGCIISEPFKTFTFYKFYQLKRLDSSKSIFIPDIAYTIVGDEDNLVTVQNPLQSGQFENNLKKSFSTADPEIFTRITIYGDQHDPDYFKMAVGTETYQIPVVKTAGNERRYIVEVYRRNRTDSEPERLSRIEGTDFDELSHYGVFKDSISFENHSLYLQQKCKHLKDELLEQRKRHEELKREFEALKAERNEYKAKYEKMKADYDNLKKERSHTSQNLGLLANAIKTLAALVTMAFTIYSVVKQSKEGV